MYVELFHFLLLKPLFIRHKGNHHDSEDFDSCIDMTCARFWDAPHPGPCLAETPPDGADTVRTAPICRSLTVGPWTSIGSSAAHSPHAVYKKREHHSVRANTELHPHIHTDIHIFLPLLAFNTLDRDHIKMYRYFILLHCMSATLDKHI